MKKLQFSAFALVTAVALAAPALANDATYSPSNVPVAGVTPFSEDVNIDITSPTSLNKSQMPPYLASVNLMLYSKPDGVADADAPTVQVNPATLSFTTTGQTNSIIATVDASSSTAPGEYAFVVSVDGPNGIGWGSGSGTTINVVVTAPAPSDTSAPVVSITKPDVDGAKYTVAQGVDIAFNAVEDMSSITALDATIDGNALTTSVTGLGTMAAAGSGSFVPDTIGTYTMHVTADSAGGHADQTRTFVANYSAVWLPPVSLGKTSKGGSTVPLKFTISDANSGFVHDDSVQVIVKEGDAVKASATSATGVKIDDISMQYLMNFQTATGVHTYTAEVFFTDKDDNPSKQACTTFSVR